MTAARLIVTAETPGWAETAGRMATGYAASVIGCDAEAGIERTLAAADTPDGRPGVSLLFFAFSRDALQKALVNRVGQCILTCPTTACFNGLPLVADKTIRIGGNLRFFGDGFQFSKKLEGRRYWRLPVMDGEFLCEDIFGTVKGVAGGLAGRVRAGHLADFRRQLRRQAGAVPFAPAQAVGVKGKPCCACRIARRPRFQSRPSA